MTSAPRLIQRSALGRKRQGDGKRDRDRGDRR
jgi:hypothetical protein